MATFTLIMTTDTSLLQTVNQQYTKSKYEDMTKNQDNVTKSEKREAGPL